MSLRDLFEPPQVAPRGRRVALMSAPEAEVAAQRQKARKDKVAARKRAYYERNKDKVAALQRAYRERNKDKVAALQRAYRERNKDKWRTVYAANRRRKLRMQ